MVDELKIITEMFKDLTPYAVYGTLAYISVKSLMTTGIICLTVCYVVKQALAIPTKEKSDER